MEVKNYIKIESKIPFRKRYIYLDTEEYYADQLFVKYEIPVRFGFELTHPDHPYIFIDCKFWSKDEHKFLKALRELPNKMLLCGYKDYIQVCEQTVGEIDNFFKTLDI